MKLPSAYLALALSIPAIVAGSKDLAVRIVGRQYGRTEYSYVVPGYSQTTASVNAACVGGVGSANCSGAGSSTASGRPAVLGSYSVTGATLTLQLRDGRLAVVNCASKANLTEWSVAPRRSCRFPLTNDISAEFDGDKAKLKWVVSIDGKKVQSETYKILAVFAAPR